MANPQRDGRMDAVVLVHSLILHQSEELLGSVSRRKSLEKADPGGTWTGFGPPTLPPSSSKLLLLPSPASPQESVELLRRKSLL